VLHDLHVFVIRGIFQQGTCVKQFYPLLCMVMKRDLLL